MSSVKIGFVDSIGSSGWYSEGPFKDSNNNYWLLYHRTNDNMLCIRKSTDSGVTYPTEYVSTQTIIHMDGVFDQTNGIIYVAITERTASKIQIWKFTISSTTWARVDSGTGPTCRGYHRLMRKSTGAFTVVYDGPQHSSMSVLYNSVYYANCTSAGVWSAGVEMDAGGAVDFALIDSCLGASDRVHVFYNSSTPATLHRSVSGTTMDTAGTIFSSKVVYGGAYWSSRVGLIFGFDSSGYCYRGTSQAGPTWTKDGGIATSGHSKATNTNLAFFDDGTVLYLVYGDTRGVYYWNTDTSGTAWDGPVSLIQPDFGGYTGGAGGEMVYGGSGTFEMIGQSFTPIKDMTLDHICFEAAGALFPFTDYWVAKIRTDSITGAVIATSNNFDLDYELTGFYSAVKFIFSSPPSLSNGVKYYMTIERTGSRDTSHYAYVNTSTFSYAGGEAYQKDNGVWNTLSNADFVICYPFIPSANTCFISKLQPDTVGFCFVFGENSSGINTAVINTSSAVEYSDTGTIRSVTTPSASEVVGLSSAATIAGVTTPGAIEYLERRVFQIPSAPILDVLSENVATDTALHNG